MPRGQCMAMSHRVGTLALRTSLAAGELEDLVTKAFTERRPEAVSSGPDPNWRSLVLHVPHDEFIQGRRLLGKSMSPLSSNQSIWLQPFVALPCWTLQKWERRLPCSGGQPWRIWHHPYGLRESFPREKAFMGKQELVASSKAALKVATLAPWSSKSLELGFDPINFPPEE